MPDKTINGIVTWLKNWFYDETEVNALLNEKQDTLVSGSNIKTINNQSLLGQGNISLQGGGSDVVDLIYPIGSIYMSVNDVNPEMLFGGEWEQIKDKFLLSSGDVYTNGATGGEATHTLTTDEMPSHTHTQDSHNHTQNAHHHTPTTTNNKYLTTTQNIKISGSTRAWTSQVSSKGTHYVYVENTDYTSATMTEEANTKNTTATNQSTTATNQNTGGGQAHNNMPPYLAVNVWKRTA